MVSMNLGPRVDMYLRKLRPEDLIRRKRSETHFSCFTTLSICLNDLIFQGYGIPSSSHAFLTLVMPPTFTCLCVGECYEDLVAYKGCRKIEPLYARCDRRYKNVVL